MHTRVYPLLQTRPAKTVALFLSITALTLTAIHPLTFGAMPDTPDGLLHLHRLVALDHAIRHGDLWPRYVPGLLYGYGAPLFNYYAPLSLYPLEGLHLLGLSFLDAFLVGMILYVFLGAWGAYLLGKAWGGPVAGVATAVAYTYAPYVLYDWPRRGAMAEFVALIVLPWVLYAFWRVATYGRRRDLVLAVVCFSAFIPIHNITALYGMGLLVTTSIFLWWVSPDPRRALVRLALVLALSLGLTAFFWLPALAETRYVYLGHASGGVGGVDFRDNFQTLGETLALPLTADLTQLHPPVRRTLGWPQIVLGVLGLALIIWPRVKLGEEERSRRRGWLVLVSIFLVGSVFLTTKASTFVWETLPLLHFTLFPWRLLGPASLFLAVLAGMGLASVFGRIHRPTVQATWVGLCLVVMITCAMPWLYGVYLPDPQAGTIVDTQNFERRTGWVAATSFQEYIPWWTTELPDANRLLGLYAQDEVIPRLQPNPNLSIEKMAWGTMDATLIFIADSDTTLVFDWLYFPGWWALLDGETVGVAPTGPQGFLGVDVATGVHILEIGFGPTPLRLGAMITSLVFLALMVGGLVLWERVQGSGEVVAGSQSDLQTWPVMIVALLAGVIIFSGKALIIDNIETPIKRARFANGLEAGLQTPVQIGFAHEITLLGYDLPASEVASGREAWLNLYWQLAGGMIEENYSSVVYLRDATGNIVLQTGSLHPADFPTSDWVPSFYLQERLTLEVPSATPPGEYDILAALYSPTAGRNLDVFDAGGNSLGVAAEIGTLTVTRPRRPARIGDLEIGVSLDSRLADDVVLLGVNSLPASSEVGRSFALVTYWRASGEPEQDYQARLIWLSGDDQVAAAAQHFPLVTGYSATQWSRRDVWKGIRLMYVPGRLETGRYDVAMQLVEVDGEPIGEPVILAQMEVSTPPRTFEMPEILVKADVEWENGIHLAGYDLPKQQVTQGNGLDLVLYWHPEDELTTGLTVFVHLVDSEGNIVAQRDQIPSSGARPTTGWAPGEFVADPYMLPIGPSVPLGEYRVRIGWYNNITGERIHLPEDDDFWVLPHTIQVIGGS